MYLLACSWLDFERCITGNIKSSRCPNEVYRSVWTGNCSQLSPRLWSFPIWCVGCGDCGIEVLNMLWFRMLIMMFIHSSTYLSIWWFIDHITSSDYHDERRDRFTWEARVLFDIGTSAVRLFSMRHSPLSTFLFFSSSSSSSIQAPSSPSLRFFAHKQMSCLLPD